MSSSAAAAAVAAAVAAAGEQGSVSLPLLQYFLACAEHAHHLDAEDGRREGASSQRAPADGGPGAPVQPQTGEPQLRRRASKPSLLLPPKAANAAGPGATSVRGFLDEEAVREFAVGLGIDPDEDSDLMWIVEEAFQAPLPGGWTEHVSENDLVYFFNSETGESTWEHPLDRHYRALLGEKRAERAGGAFYVSSFS
eukprot:tig00000615_g2560.t1